MWDWIITNKEFLKVKYIHVVGDHTIVKIHKYNSSISKQANPFQNILWSHSFRIIVEMIAPKVLYKGSYGFYLKGMDLLICQIIHYGGKKMHCKQNPNILA
jgi:hypothetical protein